MRRLFLVLTVFLAGCSDRIEAPVVPQMANSGVIEPVFVATNRAEINPGQFGIGRSPDLQLMQMDVSIPLDRVAGEISNGEDRPRPNRDFVLVRREDFSSANDFRSSLSRAVSASGTSEVTIYVHGFNNSFADSTFRIAQLSHDLDIQGPVVSFSWPSRGNPLGYQYDADSAAYSRDSLAELLQTVERTGVQRIFLVAHSMGSWLSLETLRQIELQRPGWAERTLGGVLLISPDVNVDVFRSQTAVFRKWPQPFVIVSSREDILLKVSGALRGEDRQLGVLDDISEIEDLPVIVLDVTAFSEGKSAGHFIAGTSESFIDFVNASESIDSAFLSGQQNPLSSFLGSRRVLGRVIEVELYPGDK